MNDERHEYINAQEVKRLITSVIKVKDEIGGNPGVDLFKNDTEEEFALFSIKEKSGYRYIKLKNSGYVIWGKKPIDKLLQAFRLLKVKDGFKIDGYYFYESMGGNFQAVAFLADTEMPDWADNENNPVFSPDKIPASLDTDFETYIIPSGTAESYFQKSLFIREVYAHGAFWHGCGDWSIRGVVTDKKELHEKVTTSRRVATQMFRDMESMPEVLEPSVSRSETDGAVTVSFYFFSEGLGATRGLFHIIDLFTTDGGVKSERKCIIEMGPGPIP